MYSVVLMAAMTTGSATPDFGHHRCCGCYGGYGGYGYSCYGCYGCYGCWGGYGGGCWGYGCYGGCVGLYGCYGGWSCYGCAGCSGYAPLYVAPQQRMPSGEQAPPPRKEKTETSARARLVVRVPADAQLFIDDNLMKSSSTQRTFVTPLLRPGQTYFYDLRAEVTRDGKTVSQSRRVLMRPGDAVEAAFTELDRPAATVSAEDR